MEKTWLTMFKSFPQCLPFTIVAKLWFELRFFSNSKNAFQYNRELWILTTGKAYFEITFRSLWASLVAQLVKNPPAMQETWVWSLGWEDPREKGMANYSSILAWRIKERLQRVGHDWATIKKIKNLVQKCNHTQQEGHRKWASPKAKSSILPGACSTQMLDFKDGIQMSQASQWAGWKLPPLQLCLSPLLLPKPLLLGDGYFLLPLQLYAQFHPCLLVILRPCCLGPLHQ